MNGLNKKQTDFIIALMTCDTIAQAQNMAGISQASAYKYLKDARVKQAMSDLRMEVMRNVTNKLMTSGTQAVQALTDIMNDTNAPQTARVSASRAILEHLTKAFEISDIRERLDRLEANTFDE